jgi:nitric oxide reductase subunit B
MRFGAGVAVVLGALLFVFATLFPRREIIAPDKRAAAEKSVALTAAE